MKIEKLKAGSAQLTVYLWEPAAVMPLTQTRPLVLVVPGGGYEHVSQRESDPVAVRFLAAGYHAAVLRYSVGEGARDYRPLAELHEALALLRAHADEWGIRPRQIAVCGFSAGGHLALSSAVLDLPGHPADQQRPNALILSYPVVTLSGGDDGTLCPPGKFCPAHRDPGYGGPSGFWPGGQDHPGGAAGLCLAYHGGRHRPGGKHPDAGVGPASGRRTL